MSACPHVCMSACLPVWTASRGMGQEELGAIMMMMRGNRLMGIARINVRHDGWHGGMPAAEPGEGEGPRLLVRYVVGIDGTAGRQSGSPHVWSRHHQ